MSGRCQSQPLGNPTKNTNMKTCISTIGAMAVAASLCFGQDQPPKGPGGPGGPGGPEKGKRPPPEEIFKKLDTSGDGTLSLEEFKASPKAQKDPAKAEEIFKKIDADSDGSVTLEEFKKHRPPHGPGGPGGPGAPKKENDKGDGEGAPPPPAE